MTTDPTSRFASLADAVSHGIPGRWRFRPTGLFLIDEREFGATMGDLWYENRQYEIGHAVRLPGDWVFAMERMTPEGRVFQPQNTLPLDAWLLVAFHGTDHYNFGVLTTPPELPLILAFLGAVTGIAVPLLGDALFAPEMTTLEARWAALITWIPTVTALTKASQGKQLEGGGYGRS